MNQPYIYESKKNRQRNKELSGSEAIIMLPDIYCQTDYSKQTAEQFAESFGRPVFLLDYFYPVTGKANNISQDEKDLAISLISKLDPTEFVTFFQKALGEIKTSYPSIQAFTVIGFCFGGRLAYIAGGEKDVSKIISLYGAGLHTPNYIEGKTPIEYLRSKRARDGVSVHSFFGTKDPSIPEADRQKIKVDLAEAGISYESHEYEAGHSYFQEGKSGYDEIASRASWEILKRVI